MATFVNYTGMPVIVDGFPMMVPKGRTSDALSVVHGDNLDGMPMRYVKRVPESLPEPEDGTYVVVQPMVAAMYPERDDLLFPAERHASHDGIIRCAALGKVPKIVVDTHPDK